MSEQVNYILKLKDDFSSVIKKADKSAENFNTSIKSINKSFIALRNTALVAMSGVAFKKAIDISVEYEKEMSNVKALTQASQDQFLLLQQQAEGLGRTTVFSAKQAAEGMSFLAMAGFNINDIMQALPGTLDLAAAGTIDLGRAADIASNVLTQFNLKANEMNRVNDIIVKTTTRSNTNIEQLSEGLKYTGTTAKILKMSLEETSAALGVLANAGLQGSMGGTSLNFALLEMSRKTAPTAKKLQELGVVTHGVNGDFVGLTNILTQFEEKGIKSTTILDIFGARGGRAMGTLVEAGTGAIKTLTDLNAKSEGIAKAIAKIKLDNLAGDMTLLKSATEGLSISFGKRLTPGLRSATQFSTKLINKFEEIIRVPLAEDLKKQQIEVFGLTSKLRNLNLSENERTVILEKLKQINPDIVKGLDAENLSINKLNSNLADYNKQMAKRIVLANLTEQEQKLINKDAEKLIKIESLLYEKSSKYGKGLGVIREELANLPETHHLFLRTSQERYLKTIDFFIKNIQSGNADMAQNIMDLNRNDIFQKGGILTANAKEAIDLVKKINKQYGKQISLRERINRLEKELEVNQPKPVMQDVILDEKNKTTLDKENLLSQTITSAAPKIFNINITKLIEKQEINTTNLTEGSDKIKKIITEIFLNGLNEAQIMVGR